MENTGWGTGVYGRDLWKTRGGVPGSMDGTCGKHEVGYRGLWKGPVENTGRQRQVKNTNVNIH